MKLDIMEIVKRSWDITWKYKWLWFLGFLVSLGSGGSNFSNSFQNSSNSNSTSPNVMDSMSSFAEVYWVMILILVMALVVIGIIISIVSVMAQGGLIGAANKIEKNETTSLKDAFAIGVKNFWKLFGLSLLLGFVVFMIVMVLVAIVAVVAVVFFAGGNQDMVGPGLACVIPLAIISVVVMIGFIILIALLTTYSTRIIVIEGAGIIQSIKSSYKLIKSRWVDTIVMYLVIAVITGVAGGILSIPGIAVMIPSALAIVGGAAVNNWGLVVVGAMGIMFGGLVTAAFGSIVSAYASVAWTITYLRITASETPEIENP